MNASVNVSFLCVFFLSLIKSFCFFPREVRRTPSTLIQSSPEKWFPALWVGLQSSPPAPAPATPLMGSPLWPPRTASCDMRMGPSCTGTAVTLHESYDATSSRTAAAFPYMTSTELWRDSPCWRWDNKRTALLRHTYFFFFCFWWANLLIQSRNGFEHTGRDTQRRVKQVKSWWSTV